MAGHSQWSNIKFRKAKQDAQKSKIFSKFSKEIYYYAKLDPDENSNPSLKNIIILARSSDVPNQIIEKAIKKAKDETVTGCEVIYECMKAKSAFIVIAITNNKSRTAAEVREILRKHRASISKCQYLFEPFYMIKIFKTSIKDEIIYLCEKLEEDEEFFYLFFSPERVSEARKILKELVLERVVFIPKDTVESSSELEIMLSELENLEDVYQVFCNLV